MNHPVYLDHAAATPMRPAAIDAMAKGFAVTGNAASVHRSGRVARRLVEESREAIAGALGARPSEVIFTAGGTESDNLAIKGLFWARRAEDPRRRRVLIGSTEHHAVLDAAQWLVEQQGAEITWIPVTSTGIITPGALREAIGNDASSVALISIMWANNEVGSINPMPELAAVAAEAGLPMHSDAVQAAGSLRCDFAASGLAALTLTAHKLGGPHGAGALLLRRDVACQPLQHGGGHERDVRSGTPDVAAVLGMAATLEQVADERSAEHARLAALRDRLREGIMGIDPTAIINGPTSHDAALPTILNATFPGCEGDSLLMLMDAHGVECSTGSACTAGVARASHVLVAMGMDARIARGTLRFSLGHPSSVADVDRALEVLPQAVERARMAGLASTATAERTK
ncbi:cysteine desulfurase [Hoyosella sp. G463]|uniref:Cysteine desulfurase n=1 Tax=Lolliginicoccus lacisalsi TaxID=2742202 RepID=A0A927JET0_9ACTN|nr:cysteine desulfurase family protein [Lolliginicoccus lacisalsi]MBD8507540.1 cysteine desulfurase [Lolliginicoccus lacisalsi]